MCWNTGYEVRREIQVSLYGKGISGEQKQQQLSTDAKGFCTIVFPVASPEYVRFNIKAAGCVPVYAYWSNRENTREPDPIPESFVFPMDEEYSLITRFISVGVFFGLYMSRISDVLY